MVLALHHGTHATPCWHPPPTIITAFHQPPHHHPSLAFPPRAQSTWNSRPSLVPFGGRRRPLTQTSRAWLSPPSSLATALGPNGSSGGLVGILVSLLASATTGLVLERYTRVGQALSGSLLAFLLHCGLSNLGIVPAECPAYDWCWSYVLPASLSLSVLLAAGAQDGQDSSRQLSQDVRRVGVAYVIGAIGSVIGAALAFWHSQAARTLPRETARKVMAAVAATYIGGTVNFFQVAEAVGLGHEGGKSVLGAIAAADIFLMGTYFAFLIICHRSSTLRRAYPSSSYGGTLQPIHHSSSSSTTTLVKKVPSLALAITLSFTISYLARAVEKAMRLPGISAAVITATSLAVFTGWRARNRQSFRGVQSTVSTTSSLFFNIFFAAIGAGARISQILTTGPAMTAFMGITLVVHTMSLAVGVWAVNRSTKAGVGISEMVCASNANIGGPATAAAMATSLDCHHLVVPCTVFGTVGYALATLLGVVMYNGLGSGG